MKYEEQKKLDQIKEERIKKLCEELRVFMEEGYHWESLVKEELLKDDRCPKCWSKISKQNGICWGCFESDPYPPV
jgi:hypothetical protein